MFNIKKLVVLILCAGLVFQAHFGIAGPQGGKVVGGNANISQSGSNTTINQTSDRAIINWNSFDIGKNESVRHNMPSSNSAGLHRVVGNGGPSNIDGLLQSNGNVYLVNPAGVLIHNGAKIDVNGFVATSRDIANENFMKGKMVFDKPGMSGAAIINQGNISLKDNGLAALVAPTVRNDGIITGKLGKVALGGSDAAWKLDMTGDDLIAFTMDEKQVNALYAADGTPLASVQNNGKIKAEGGVVVLTASQLDGIVGSVVNNGEISAASAETKGGKIIFRGEGNKVDVVNNGQLDVSSKAAEGGNVRMTGQAAVTHAGKIDATGKTKGGNVVITGENVTLKSGSRIDASGTNGGGTVLVGGNARGKGPEVNAKTTLVQSDAEILADAKLVGDGGQIVVWADQKTQFDGKATARGGENGGNGGLVETSAKLLIIGDPAVVNTSAKKGKAGEWLLDPEDFVIAAANGDITGQKLSESLALNNVAIQVDPTTGAANGDIFVNDDIVWTSDRSLSLEAYRNIIVNAPITANNENSGIYLTTPNGGLIVNSHIDLPYSSQTLVINGLQYYLVNNVQELQDISKYVKRNYALGSNIDASATKDWNNGKGFEPIQHEDGWTTYFGGIFNGLGHSIKDLSINRPGYDGNGEGLFSWLREATVENLTFSNPTIVGHLYSGVLAGKISDSLINNVRLNAVSITTGYSGGLVGGLTSVAEDSVIIDVHINGSVSGYSSTGGLIGRGENITVRDSSANVGVIRLVSEGKQFLAEGVGGFIGLLKSGNIERSFTYGTVEMPFLADPKYQWEENTTSAGGFVGRMLDGQISDSYAAASVFTRIDKGHPVYSLPYSGGFIGYGKKGLIENSYSVGDVSGPYPGGFIGYQETQNMTIRDSYWDMEKSGQTESLYDFDGPLPDYNNTLKGLTTTEMQTKASFVDWDFKKTWSIKEGQNYPELRRPVLLGGNPLEPEQPDPENPTPVDPDPVDPTPVDPDPVDPTPIDPDPVDPTPVDPDPVDPTPVDPDPVDPKPVDPDPVDPTPVDPDPVYPKPVDPDPVDPKPVDPTPEQPSPVVPRPVNPTPEQPRPENPALGQPEVTPSNPLPDTTDKPDTPAQKPANSSSATLSKPSQSQPSGNILTVTLPGETLVFKKSDGVVKVYEETEYVRKISDKSFAKNDPMPAHLKAEIQDEIINFVGSMLPEMQNTRKNNAWHDDINELNMKYIMYVVANKTAGEIISQTIMAGLGTPKEIVSSLKNLITDKATWQAIGKYLLSGILLSYADYFSGARYDEITNDMTMSQQEKDMRHLWCLYNSSIYHALGLSIMQSERDKLEEISDKSFPLQVVHNTIEVAKSTVKSILQPIVNDYTSGKAVLAAGHPEFQVLEELNPDWYKDLKKDFKITELLKMPGFSNLDKAAILGGEMYSDLKTLEKNIKSLTNHLSFFFEGIAEYVDSIYSDPAVKNIAGIIELVNANIPGASQYNERPFFEKMAIDFNNLFK